MGEAKRLLIVDDEEEITRLLENCFVELGIDVWTAATGEEALEKLKKEQPDLMLLDIKLETSVSGMEVLQKTKKISPLTKVIMLTGVESRSMVEEALRLGAIDYIVKPFSIELLETDVMSVLDDGKLK